MKARNSGNRIDRLVTDAGVTLSSQVEIEQEILGFYKNLLGEAKQGLLAVDVVVVRRGNCLNEEQRQSFFADVQLTGIDLSIYGIHKDSTSDIGGFRLSFFQGLWSLIKSDIYHVVRQFFARVICFMLSTALL